MRCSSLIGACENFWVFAAKERQAKFYVQADPAPAMPCYVAYPNTHHLTIRLLSDVVDFDFTPAQSHIDTPNMRQRTYMKNAWPYWYPP